MINVNKKILFCAAFVLCLGIFSVPLEARSRFNFSFNVVTPVARCRPCPPPVYVVPAPSRTVYIERSYPVYTPTTTVIASRPSNWERYQMHDHPYSMNRRIPTCGETLEVYDYSTSCCEQEVVCLPTISAIYECGELVQLNDGSLWEVRACDRGMTKNWMQNDTVQLTRSNDRCNPFTLTNSCSKTSVRATMKAGPVK